MKNIILSRGNVFVALDFLRNEFQVSQNTIKSWLKRKADDILRTDSGSIAIKYEAIPQSSRQKYGLKSKEEFITIAKQTDPEQEVESLTSQLEQALLLNAHSFASIYRGRFSELHTLKYSRLHCLYTELYSIQKSVSIKLLHKAVLNLSDSPLPLKSYPSFTHKLNCAFVELEKGLLSDFVPSRKHENNNREKLQDEDETILNELFRNPIKRTKKECYYLYKDTILHDYGKEPVSYKTAARFLSSNKSKLVCFKSRYGNEQFKAEIGIHTKRTKGKNSFILCAADGLQLGRSVIFKDKTIGQVTIWIYYDWFSGAILGYAINRTETFELIRAGFRDLLKRNNGICPRELVIDTKWANSAEINKLFNKAGILIRKKKPYTPEDSIAERNNQEFNKIHRAIDSGWVSITNNHKDKVHNPEHIRKTPPAALAELHKIITEIVSIYNLQPMPETGKSRFDVLMDNVCENPKTINALDQVILFGDSRVVTIRNGHFELKVNTKKYEFEVYRYHDHYDKLDGMKVRVHYDLTDMSSVEVFYIKSETDQEQDTYLGTCKATNRFNPSKIARTDEDNQHMSHQLKRKAQLEKIIQTKEAKHHELVNTFDVLSSLERAGQDRYKVALESEVAKRYRSIDESNEEALELVSVEPDKPRSIKKRESKASLEPIPKDEVEFKNVEFKRL